MINKIKVSFAFSILSPPMDPLRSRKNIYYPFALSTFISNFLPAIEALYASSTLRWQNFGTKESIAVDPESVFPRTKLGNSISFVVKLNTNPLLSLVYSEIVNLVLVFSSF